MNDYMQALARGMVTGGSTNGSYGEKTFTGASSGILWPGGQYVVPPASGLQMSLVSTSANDTVGGTGINSVVLHCLDDNLEPFEEVVELNDLTPVLTVATNIRFIQCFHLVSVGSGKAAAGTVSASNGATNYAIIPAGHVRCPSSVRMVPKGHRLVVTSMTSGSSSGTSATTAIVRLVATSLLGFDLTSQSVFFPYCSSVHQDDGSFVKFDSAFVFSEGQAVGLSYETDKSATVVGQWTGYLENATS